MLPLNQIFPLDAFCDTRGDLCVFESIADFQIHRVFWIQNVPPGATRGNHASIHDNKIVVLTAGNCKIDLHDGETKRSFSLCTPMHALLIPSMTWNRLYDFSADCVLTVLVDRLYSPNDVITDFDAFIATARHSRPL